ncbi:hypothetical protein [Streptomyces zaomyceticus]|uniref:hypothetical protein n=1 Tax=Streptomyces zaomyceticus TaxID=68286 RepID=UPI003433D4D3
MSHGRSAGSGIIAVMRRRLSHDGLEAERVVAAPDCDQQRQPTAPAVGCRHLGSDDRLIHRTPPRPPSGSCPARAARQDPKETT